MRKFLIGLVAMTFVAVACGSNDDNAGATGSTGSTGPTGATSSPTAAQTAADCAQGATLTAPGTFTVGTDNPAYPPYFQGGTAKGSEWKFNDPNNDKGFESTVAYAVADKLGFSADQVMWTVVPFAQSYAPGPKSFDVDINQISYKPARAQAVDFSESYYDVNQALVAVKGTPITQATTIADLKPYTLASQLGTTSYDYIVNTIQPDDQPGVYQKLSDAVAAINAGQIDGLVVDLPTALYMADPFVQQVKHSTVVGQFPNPSDATPEYFGMVLPKDSSLTACVNLALQEMKDDGSLAALTKEWLSDKTNVGTVPEFGV
jgi:polar amino acid transport system substrate-binding protein